MLDSYLSKLARRMSRDDYREESFYPALGELMITASAELSNDQVDVTPLPRKTEAGNPDFRIWDGEHRIIGYIEAKQPGTDLHKIQNSEQLKRYRNTFPNLILTDFFEYWLFKDGQLTDKVQIGRPFVAQKLGEIPPAEHLDEFMNLMEQFFAHSVPRTLRASSLAKELARRTRFLEHIIETELVDEQNKQLTGFYQAFRQYLIAGLDKKEFADLYAQTVTYGLFAARTRAAGNEPFTREKAREYIPATIGILRDVFDFISYRKLPQNISWIVDDIAEILDAADINKILKRYYDEGKGKDPIIHFYETFLSEYNPSLREQRGVYYTPEPVVGYIVRSVHHMLKEDFDKPLGLADSSVTVLDPASGTLTFIAEAFRIAVNEYKINYGEGGVSELIKDHLLENFYAFELMMAPYAIGHLKMGFILDELGHTLEDDERFKLYLTNSLEMEDLAQTELPGMASLSEESRAAGKIKKEEEVLVILGNPPYSGNSFNRGKLIEKLLKDGYTHENGYEDDGYYTLDGKPLKEKNSKWLQDDYVKFIRFAQWKIDQYGQGIVSMITNHGYLDNPTFRGMRESMMKSFDEISVLDLHGNSLKKETAPDGSKDENVFDIRQGVAINFSIKKNGKQSNIYRSDRFSLRSYKYEWLKNNSKNSTEWTELKPQSPFYFFKEQNYELNNIYRQFLSINDLFPINSVGIVTARDHFTLHWNKDEAWRKITRFKDLPTEEARLLFDIGDDSKNWKVKFAQSDIKQSGPSKKQIVPFLYRPFDKRYTYYTGNSRGFHCRPRSEIMTNMIVGKNMGLISPKRVELDQPWSNCFISEEIIGHVIVSSKTIDYLFPLYIYPEPETNTKNNTTIMMVFEEGEEYTERQPNINKEFYNLLEHTYGTRPTPEQILYYIYAVLYAPAYRQTYAEFLKSDFPRIPFTTNYDLFCEMSALGEQITGLHLMKSDKLNNPIAKFQGQGNNVIAKAKKVGRNYQPEEQRVYINKERQYFEGIPEEVWEYQVGGYQVMDKWLYDRRERKLSNEEIQHYCRVTTALYHTIELQKEIDEIYPGVEQEVIEWQ